jgi:hypothetical protein
VEDYKFVVAITLMGDNNRPDPFALMTIAPLWYSTYG